MNTVLRLKSDQKLNMRAKHRAKNVMSWINSYEHEYMHWLIWTIGLCPNISEGRWRVVPWKERARVQGQGTPCCGILSPKRAHVGRQPARVLTSRRARCPVPPGVGCSKEAVSSYIPVLSAQLFLLAGTRPSHFRKSWETCMLYCYCFFVTSLTLFYRNMLQ